MAHFLPYRNAFFYTALCFSISLVLTESCSQKSDKLSSSSEKNAAPEVNGLIVREQTLDNRIEVNGNIIANEQVELRSEIAGRVTALHFDEGQTVTKNQTLLTINDSELQAQLLKNTTQLELYVQDEARKRKLLEIQGISQEEYDIALNKLNSTKADLALIRSQLEKTCIKAPFNGRIGLRSISTGSYVTPSTLIATLLQINPIKIEFSVPEQYATQIRSGTNIRFSVTGNSKVYNGTVYAIEPQIEASTRTLKVRARSVNPDNEIIPGSFAKVSITLQTVANALLLPTDLIIPEQNRQKVFVYQNGQAVSQAVETGIRTDKYIQILSGLKRGDTIITSGLMQLRNEMPVVLKSVQ